MIAAARYYELTGDRRYRNIAESFWKWSVSAPIALAGPATASPGTLDPAYSRPSSARIRRNDIAAYNMMKLTRHLFGWTPDASHMDYYERTRFNHRLGTINPEGGTMMYYLPLASGHWKTFGKPFDALWCCTGTESEEYAKLADTI